MERKETRDADNGEHRSPSLVDRQQEVRKNRERLRKEGISTFFLTPLIAFWKNEPFLALFTFFKWVILMYLGMSLLQAVFYDTQMCDSIDDTYDGKMIYVYNDYVRHANEYIAEQREELQQQPRFTLNEQGMPVYSAMSNNPTYIGPKKDFIINCTTTIQHWYTEPIEITMRDIGYAFGKIVARKS